MNTSGFVFDEDDRTVGEIYGRRRALALLGAGGGALLLSACGGAGADLAALAETNASLPAGCVVRPALTEGPIFVDDQANRSDIRTDPTTGEASEGTALALAFRVSTLANGSCSRLEGAQVDVWQCDAFGIYSDTDFEDMGTVGQQFLRGHQFTDADGACAFTTVYPGWYDGRAVHIHFKIRTTDGHEFTSQLFFDPEMTNSVFAAAPYNTKGERTVRNEDDGIYEESGDQMLLAVTSNDAGVLGAAFDITLDLS